MVKNTQAELSIPALTFTPIELRGLDLSSRIGENFKNSINVTC
jgi:hypothetical protein